MKTLNFIPTNYPSDLTDEEWQLIEAYFVVGNQSKYSKRSLMDAVRYKIKTGCQWRQIPDDFPTWETVWSFYRRACKETLFEKITDDLMAQNLLKDGRKSSPTYGLNEFKKGKVGRKKTMK